MHDNRHPVPAAAAVTAGARLAPSPRDAAEHAGVVIGMVAGHAASRNLWLGEDGALRAVASGAVAVECGALSPAWVRELAARRRTNRAPKHFTSSRRFFLVQQ
jgi:3-hydroxyisobutyrate dehydrogenase-like beta-hydroxyacid dehydrogenase